MTIVYTSETGFTKEYAQLLGNSLNFPVYSLAEALESLEQNRPIFYMGWLMAGQIQGLDKAKKKFDVKGICGVGIRPDVEHMTQSLEKSNHMPPHSAFYLPGGYHPDLLKGGKKVALTVVLSILKKKIQSQSSISSEEEELLRVFSVGGSFVNETHLVPLIAWLEQHNASKENS